MKVTARIPWPNGDKVTIKGPRRILEKIEQQLRPKVDSEHETCPELWELYFALPVWEDRHVGEA